MAVISTGSKTVPQVGESFIGDDPAVVKVIKITAGFDCGDVTGVETTGAHVLLNIPANIIVERVAHLVVTAWTATVTFQVGDCDSAGQFINTAASSTTAGFAAETGLQVMQYYDTPSALIVTVAGTAPLAGKSDFFVFYNMAGQNSTY